MGDSTPHPHLLGHIEGFRHVYPSTWLPPSPEFAWRNSRSRMPRPGPAGARRRRGQQRDNLAQRNSLHCRRAERGRRRKGRYVNCKLGAAFTPPRSRSCRFLDHFSARRNSSDSGGLASKPFLILITTQAKFNLSSPVRALAGFLRGHIGKSGDDVGQVEATIEAVLEL